MRTRTAAALLAVSMGLGWAPAASAAAPASLDVSPTGAVVPATVIVGGSCPAVGTRTGPMFPSSTELTLDGTGAGPWTVPLDSTGSFTGFVAGVSGNALPGRYTFATACGGSTPFAVLGAPSLTLDPAGVRAGATTAASGTCPKRYLGTVAGPEVLLDGTSVGTAPADAATGEFGPLPVAVPDGAALGEHVVTTSCGGQSTLTVLAPAAPPSVPPSVPPAVPSAGPPASPGATLVVVPDLRGLTVTEAVAALGDRLVLADPGGGAGRVRSQDPPAGTRVQPGSAVTVVLEAVAVQPSGDRTPIVVGVAIALVVVLGAALLAAGRAVRGRRLRREQRWLDEHLAVVPDRAYLRLSEGPDGGVPGTDVQLVTRRGPARLQPQGARDDTD